MPMYPREVAARSDNLDTNRVEKFIASHEISGRLPDGRIARKFKPGGIGDVRVVMSRVQHVPLPPPPSTPAPRPTTAEACTCPYSHFPLRRLVSLFSTLLFVTVSVHSGAGHANPSDLGRLALEAIHMVNASTEKRYGCDPQWQPFALVVLVVVECSLQREVATHILSCCNRTRRARPQPNTGSRRTAGARRCEKKAWQRCRHEKQKSQKASRLMRPSW